MKINTHIKLSIGLLAVLFFFISSCGSPKKDWKFTKADVSFTGPGDWKITDKDNLDGAGYYVSIEKTGLESSGLYVLTWVNQILDSQEYLEELQDGFESRKELENVVFETVRNTDYNGIPAISSNFSFTLLDLEHKGTIYVFSKSNKTYSITEHGATEDELENQDGFQLIESTFIIR